MGEKKDDCPEGKVEGMDLTKCQLKAMKHLTDNVCKKLKDLNIDCDKLFDDVKDGKITKDEFMQRLVHSIVKGKPEQIKEAKELVTHR